jgi:hypothetical protein
MSDRTDGTDRTDRDVSTTAWVVAAVAAIAVVLMVAYARRDPGFDDRVPDPPADLAQEVDDVD